MVGDGGEGCGRLVGLRRTPRMGREVGDQTYDIGLRIASGTTYGAHVQFYIVKGPYRRPVELTESRGSPALMLPHRSRRLGKARRTGKERRK